MPQIASQKKALRAAQHRHLSNKKTLQKLKTVLRRPSTKTINTAYKTVDKAARQHLIHPNRAARIKSRLAGLVGGTPQKNASRISTPASKARKRSAPKKAR